MRMLYTFTVHRLKMGLIVERSCMVGATLAVRRKR